MSCIPKGTVVETLIKRSSNGGAGGDDGPSGLGGVGGVDDVGSVGGCCSAACAIRNEDEGEEEDGRNCRQTSEISTLHTNPRTRTRTRTLTSSHEPHTRYSHAHGQHQGNAHAIVTSTRLQETHRLKQYLWCQGFQICYMINSKSVFHREVSSTSCSCNRSGNSKSASAE